MLRFIKGLFTNHAAERAAIRRYVTLEFRPEERESAYHRLVREAGF